MFFLVLKVVSPNWMQRRNLFLAVRTFCVGLRPFQTHKLKVCRPFSISLCLQHLPPPVRALNSSSGICLLPSSSHKHGLVRNAPSLRQCFCNEPDMAEQRFLVEYAKRGTAGCKKCKDKIQKGIVRIGKIVPNPFSESAGEMKEWYHVKCIFEKLERARATTKKIEDITDLEGWEELQDEDKELVNKHVSGTNRYYIVCIVLICVSCFSFLKEQSFTYIFRIEGVLLCKSHKIYIMYKGIFVHVCIQLNN